LKERGRDREEGLAPLLDTLLRGRRYMIGLGG